MAVDIKKDTNFGFASFITVTFLAIILLLITTSYVKAMNSNSRETLDNQLSAQAFYAAESGINDLLKAMESANNNPTSAQAIAFNTYFNQASNNKHCDTLISNSNIFPANNNVLDSSIPIKYTCLIAKNRVPNIETSLSATDGDLYHLKSVNAGTAIDGINIRWGQDLANIFTAPNNELPQTWQPHTPAMLRVTVYYLPSGGGGDIDFSRNSLLTHQRTWFIKPSTGGGNNVNITDGSISNITCSNPPTDYQCSANINISSLPGDLINGVYILVRPIYTSADVRITATSGGVPQDLSDAQIIIDSTGRANDVYRRIVARKPIHFTNTSVQAVLTSQNNVCKQFSAEPGGVHEDDNSCF